MKKFIVGISLLFFSSPLFADFVAYKCVAVYHGEVVAEGGYYYDLGTAKEAALVKCRNWARKDAVNRDINVCDVKACAKRIFPN